MTSKKNKSLKGKSLVDSFVFREAKDAVDRITTNDQLTTKLKSNQKNTTKISQKEQDHISISKVSDMYHVGSRYVSRKEQYHITKKEQDHISIISGQKNAFFGSEFISLSLCQSKVYLWFSERGQVGEFNKPEIQKDLSMPYITVRKVIDKLVSLDLIDIFYDGCQKKYQYKLKAHSNIKLSKIALKKSGSEQDHISIISPPLNSSSSLYNKTTTKIISDILKNDPELGYWRNKKLTPQQIITWQKKTQMNLDDIFESLKHCAFEMSDLGVEKNKPVKNVFNWFWKIIERSGYYPKPREYKSYQEKALEREQQRTAKIKKEADLLKAIRKKALQAEEELEFEKMMADPESDVYKKCYDKLSSFHKRKPSTSMFETGMLAAFKELREQIDE